MSHSRGRLGFVVAALILSSPAWGTRIVSNCLDLPNLAPAGTFLNFDPDSPVASIHVEHSHDGAIDVTFVYKDPTRGEKVIPFSHHGSSSYFGGLSRETYFSAASGPDKEWMLTLGYRSRIGDNGFEKRFGDDASEIWLDPRSTEDSPSYLGSKEREMFFSRVRRGTKRLEQGVAEAAVSTLALNASELDTVERVAKTAFGEDGLYVFQANPMANRWKGRLLANLKPFKPIEFEGVTFYVSVYDPAKVTNAPSMVFVARTDPRSWYYPNKMFEDNSGAPPDSPANKFLFYVPPTNVAKVSEWVDRYEKG